MKVNRLITKAIGIIIKLLSLMLVYLQQLKIDQKLKNKLKEIFGKKTVVFTFSTVAILIFGFYLYSRDPEQSIYTSTYHPTNKAILNVPRENNPKEALFDNDTIFIDNSSNMITSVKYTVKNSTESPGKTRITKPADRLTSIAYEEYGDVVFWIYIYEENKSLIDMDNYVKPNVRIIIPSPEKYGINAKDANSMQRARDFANVYINGNSH